MLFLPKATHKHGHVGVTKKDSSGFEHAANLCPELVETPKHIAIDMCLRLSTRKSEHVKKILSEILLSFRRLLTVRLWLERVLSIFASHCGIPCDFARDIACDFARR